MNWGQRRRPEKFLYRRHHRTDVDQRLRGDGVNILRLQGHFLAHYALHAGEADAELVLKQLANRTNAAIAQMVDVVGRADIVGKHREYS